MNRVLAEKCYVHFIILSRINKLLHKIYFQIGLYSNNTQNLYSGGSPFESWPEHWLS
jgi:hypothetical protein